MKVGDTPNRAREDRLNVKRVLDSLNLDQIHLDLATHYHREGPGRSSINPLNMLKAQLAKHLLRIISDRRLALRLKHDHKVARACGFRNKTPSHSLFTHFRHRLGEETYHKVFDRLTRILLESGTIIGIDPIASSKLLHHFVTLLPDKLLLLGLSLLAAVIDSIKTLMILLCSSFVKIRSLPNSLISLTSIKK